MVDGVDAQFFSATLAGCTLSKARPALTVFRALVRMDSEWLTRMIAANLYVYNCDVKDGDGSDASRKNPREGDEGDCRLRKHAGAEGRGGRIHRALVARYFSGTFLAVQEKVMVDRQTKKVKAKRSPREDDALGWLELLWEDEEDEEAATKALEMLKERKVGLKARRGRKKSTRPAAIAVV